MQEAGDLVYVPANSPHAVHNEEDITAMSMNYVVGLGCLYKSNAY
jgi:quercetin dioxygenase-like cupin family protein